MDNEEEVNWSVFDINPYNDDEDVSKKQVIDEYKKFKGTPRQFAEELDTRFGYSGAMCEIVKNWCTEYDNSLK